MELKEFVKSVLVDVCDAVDEAKKSTGSKVAIAPATVNGVAVENGQMVSFEILVTVSDTLGAKGKGRIEVLALGGSIEGDATTSQKHSSKINFQVPVFFSAKF